MQPMSTWFETQETYWQRSSLTSAGRNIPGGKI